MCDAVFDQRGHDDDETSIKPEGDETPVLSPAKDEFNMIQRLIKVFS